MEIDLREFEWLDKLLAWHKEGRAMPRYVPRNGAVYIAYLLGLWDGPMEPPFGMNLSFIDLIREANPTIMEQLNGPHGWVILQTLIARKERINGDT